MSAARKSENYRKEMTVSIEVNMTDRKTFNMQGENCFQNIFLKISEFIKNAFDAFENLKIGKIFILKVVITIDEKGLLVIKLKDNGAGFSNKEKGKYFEFDIKDKSFCVKKEKEKFGGSHVGLLWSSHLIHQLGGELKFKNRKKSGCTVYSFFKLPLLKSATLEPHKELKLDAY